MTSADALHAGEVGYLITGIKDVTKLRVGDTLTTPPERARPTQPLPGYREVKPMVFCGLFPIDSDDYPDLRDALEKLSLNDAALSWEPETCDALGFGFRCGFLGLLHMDIVRERLEREYDLELLATMPSVEYEVTLTDGATIPVHCPTTCPIRREWQPSASRTSAPRSSPRRSSSGRSWSSARSGAASTPGCTTCRPSALQLTYDLPLAEIVLDFFDQLKSRTRGYASLDYELIGLRESDLVKLDILLAGEPVDALSMLVHRSQGLRRRPDADREAPREDPAPAVRRPDPGRDRLADRRPRDDQGLPQGRHREVLRRRHHPQAQAARAAEAAASSG